MIQLEFYKYNVKLKGWDQDCFKLFENAFSTYNVTQ